MKNWLTIGQFAKKAGLSPRALRIYEEKELIHSNTRGENGYRYYRDDQLELVERIKKFKEIGFSLSEIKTLLSINVKMDSARLRTFLKQRLEDLSRQETNISNQRHQIKNILSSLDNKTEGLAPQQRRYIMSYFEKVSIIVTGVSELERTAQHIQSHLEKTGPKVEIYFWNQFLKEPTVKPYILVIPEKDLLHPEIANLSPDVVVIRNISSSSEEIEKLYLRLYSMAGPHMSTIVNADETASVKLAGQTLLKKGKIYYFSKDRGYEKEIKNIGGIISDGKDVRVFGFNRTPVSVNVRLTGALNFNEEVSILASLAAVMDIGLRQEDFPSAI